MYTCSGQCKELYALKGSFHHGKKLAEMHILLLHVSETCVCWGGLKKVNNENDIFKQWLVYNSKCIFRRGWTVVSLLWHLHCRHDQKQSNQSINCYFQTQITQWMVTLHGWWLVTSWTWYRFPRQYKQQNPILWFGFTRRQTVSKGFVCWLFFFH